MKETSPDRVGISLGLRLYAGTPLFRKIRAQGLRKENPNLHGPVEGNPEFLRPIFYLNWSWGKILKITLTD